MDDTDKHILDMIQTGFPLAPRPYAVIGEAVGLTESEALARVRALRGQGIIRRIGANFQSAKIGFSSTLCAASVPTDRLDAFIAAVNAQPGVTHNYLRDHLINVWFTMALIESDPKLTSLPDVFVRVNEVLGDPLSTSQEAAEAIGMDTGLSAKLLRLVNSAFYGFPVKVDTLSRAVTIVGSRQLTTLALGLSVLAMFKDLPGDLVDMRSFWKHSIGCGVIASSLAEPGIGGEVERLFVAGLLHDVGRLVLYRSLPRHLALVLATARSKERLLRETERAMATDPIPP